MEIQDLIEALSDPRAYGSKAAEVTVRQTHISVVFLVGDVVFKIKKSLRLGFLDYTTLEKREHYCHKEVELNRRLAPDVYLGVVPVTRDGGRVSVEGSGEVVEWAVKMKRLPEDAMLRTLLKHGVVGKGIIEELARRIADFHARAARGERISALTGFENVARNVRDNFAESRSQVGSIVHPRVFDRLQTLAEEVLSRLRPCIEERVARGRPCDTHGDLRLEHVYLFPDQPPPADIVIVDCIEFNEKFRASDPVADIAFLVMELIGEGYRALAHAFCDAYFSASCDQEGRRLLPFFVSYRAAVRGKVGGMKAGQAEILEADRVRARGVARSRWLLALGELEDPARRPCLVLIGGLPGTGKSTLAKKLADLARFTVIRTDQVRKELARAMGAEAGPASFGAGVYSSEWSERTYQACLDQARELIFQGERVLVDATFRAEAHRRAFLEMAAGLGVPGWFLICRTDEHLVRARLESRRDDLSDADWSVYLQAARRWEPTGEWTGARSQVIDTGDKSVLAADRAIQLLRDHGLSA